MPYSWQASLIEDLKQVPDGRSIFWVYSDGAHDRSALSEYLVRNMGARKAVLSGWPNWNMTDVYNTHFEDDIVLIDCPQNLSSSMKIDFYSLLEALKNGNGVAPLYETPEQGLTFQTFGRAKNIHVCHNVCCSQDIHISYHISSRQNVHVVYYVSSAKDSHVCNNSRIS